MDSAPIAHYLGYLLSVCYTQCVELIDFQPLQDHVFFLFKRLLPWWLASKTPALRVRLVRTYLTIVYRRSSRVFVLSFVRQEIQSIVRDGVMDCTTSSLPDSDQLKARGVPNQGDNQQCPHSSKMALMAKVKFTSHNYTVDEFKQCLCHTPKQVFNLHQNLKYCIHLKIRTTHVCFTYLIQMFLRLWFFHGGKTPKASLYY